jgi:hypothetical protein
MVSAFFLQEVPARPGRCPLRSLATGGSSASFAFSGHERDDDRERLGWGAAFTPLQFPIGWRPRRQKRAEGRLHADCTVPLLDQGAIITHYSVVNPENRRNISRVAWTRSAGVLACEFWQRPRCQFLHRAGTPGEPADEDVCATGLLRYPGFLQIRPARTATS